MMRPKKPDSTSRRELDQAGQEELVLDDADLDAGVARRAGERQRGLDVGGDRLLAVDVLAGGDRRPRRPAGRADVSCASK